MSGNFKKYPYQDYNAYNLDYLLEKSSTAEAAMFSAENANAIAREAQRTANDAQTTADGIAGTAQEALESATQANVTATAAQTAANAAQTAASAAQTSARNAVTTANAAQTTAESIAGTAQEALESADNAVTTANTAQTQVETLTNKFTAGTWTPAVMRANITAVSGKWFKIGDVYFLSGDITFSSNQTNQGNIYITEESLPINGNYAVYGLGGASYHYVLGCTSVNKNVWVAQVDIGRIPATQSGLAGDTVRFELIAVPR